MLELVQFSEAVDKASDASLEGRVLPASPDLSVELKRRNRELAALIAQIAGGEQDALTALYDQTNRQIYGLLLRILGDPATAEEVLLDVYVQVWRQAARYESGRGTPFAWLITMARSRAIDRLRSIGNEEHHTDLLEETRDFMHPANAEEDAIASEMRRIVQAALNTLPPEQRELIELAYYNGLSHSDIAARLDQPLGTVKTRIRRAMIKLRDVLNPVVEGIL